MLPTAALCCRRPTKDAHLSRIEAASSSSSSGNHGDDDFWEWWWYNDHDVVTCVHAHVYQSTSSSFTSFLSCAPLPPLNFKKWEPCLLSPLCFVVFPPFSLSQLFPIFRFHFLLNASFLLTLRLKHPCCICFHIAPVFSHPRCYVVTFTLSLSWFSPICRIFITRMSSIKNLMKRQTGFASFQQSKVLYGRMRWDWSISYNMVWHGMIVKAWYISMVRWAR